MITNERQYKITRAQLKRFEDGLAAHTDRAASPGVHPRIDAAMREAMESEAALLRVQLREYEDLKAGRVSGRTLRSLKQLPGALIEARIAADLTQKDLADRLGVPEQQVQRWEATSYRGVSVYRLQDIAEALEVEIVEKLRFRSASTRRAE